VIDLNHRECFEMMLRRADLTSSKADRCNTETGSFRFAADDVQSRRASFHGFIGDACPFGDVGACRNVGLA